MLDQDGILSTFRRKSNLKTYGSAQVKDGSMHPLVKSTIAHWPTLCIVVATIMISGDAHNNSRATVIIIIIIIQHSHFIPSYIDHLHLQTFLLFCCLII